MNEYNADMCLHFSKLLINQSNMICTNMFACLFFNGPLLAIYAMRLSSLNHSLAFGFIQPLIMERGSCHILNKIISLTAYVKWIVQRLQFKEIVKMYTKNFS